MRIWAIAAAVTCGCVVVQSPAPPPPRAPLVVQPRPQPRPRPEPQPLALAEPTSSCATSATAREIVPASSFPNGARAFASERGIEVFWNQQPGLGQSQFWLEHRAFSPAGEPLGPPTKILDTMMRWAAAGERGTFAIVNPAGGGAWKIAALHLGNAQPLWTAAMPAGNDYNNFAIAWDPDHAQWVIVAEQRIASFDHNHDRFRLVTARLSRDGAWADSPAFISPELEHATLSDWGAPLVHADHRMAVVWEQSAMTGHDRSLHVTELYPGRTVDFVVARGTAVSFRTVLAWANGGYVIAGATFPQSLTDSRVFVARLRDGVATPTQIVSSPDRYGGEPLLASDGTRVALAWNEQDATHTTSAHSAVLDERGGMSAHFASSGGVGQTDFTQALVAGRCGFTFVFTAGINPSALVLH